MPGRARVQLASAAVWFGCAAVVAWWSIDVHRAPALGFAVNGLAVIGAFDLVLLIQNIVRTLWRQQRQSHRERS
jgi:hypothetical protein